MGQLQWFEQKPASKWAASTTFRLNGRRRQPNISSEQSIRQALDADVPEGWITGEGEGEYEGLVYYYHEATGESTWDHPLDDYYRWRGLFVDQGDEQPSTT